MHGARTVTTSAADDRLADEHPHRRTDIATPADSLVPSCGTTIDHVAIAATGAAQRLASGRLLQRRRGPPAVALRGSPAGGEWADSEGVHAGRPITFCLEGALSMPLDGR
jgi:hypothetical protein